MIQWLRFFINLSLLKIAPQDATSSKSVFYLATFAYFLVGVLIVSLYQSMVHAIIISAIQTILLLFLTNLILWMKKTPERYVQAAISLTGSGTFISLVALPVVSLITSNTNAGVIVSLVWVALVVWETAVIGHIFRHALDVPFISGLGVAIVYMYISFMISVKVLKLLAMPIG